MFRLPDELLLHISRHILAPCAHPEHRDTPESIESLLSALRDTRSCALVGSHRFTNAILNDGLWEEACTSRFGHVPRSGPHVSYRDVFRTRHARLVQTLREQNAARESAVALQLQREHDMEVWNGPIYRYWRRFWGCFCTETRYLCTRALLFFCPPLTLGVAMLLVLYSNLPVTIRTMPVWGLLTPLYFIAFLTTGSGFDPNYHEIGHGNVCRFRWTGIKVAVLAPSALLGVQSLLIGLKCDGYMPHAAWIVSLIPLIASGFVLTLVVTVLFLRRHESDSTIDTLAQFVCFWIMPAITCVQTVLVGLYMDGVLRRLVVEPTLACGALLIVLPWLFSRDSLPLTLGMSIVFNVPATIITPAMLLITGVTTDAFIPLTSAIWLVSIALSVLGILGAFCDDESQD